MSPPVAVVDDENDNEPGDKVDADDEFLVSSANGEE